MIFHENRLPAFHVFFKYSILAKCYMLKYLYVQGYKNRFICYDPRVWPAVKTFKGPCFGCDCGIKCCQLLLKRLGPKSEIAECLFNDS